MKFLNPFVTLVLSVVITSCGSSNKESADSDSIVSVEMDSVKEIIEKPISRLPDTAYASAKIVKYTVSVVDKNIPERIDNLKDLYNCAPGVLTFRGNNYREANYHGKVDESPNEFVVEWTYKTEEDFTPGKYGTWGGGTGWTGQPLYIEWPDSCLTRMRKNKIVKDGFSGKEIIVGSLCGDLYFIDYETGKNSREPIATGNPIKGTVSLDPTLNGNLYVGHGVPNNRPFGAVVFNLYTNKRTDIFPEDPKALRHWGAYDSSALRIGQFVFRPSENGGIYKWYSNGGKMSLQSVLRYTVNGVAPGIESSISVYANYGYVSDNRGNIIAVNLDTMKPVWRYYIGDDTDATAVIAVEDERPYLYVGCEIDKSTDNYSSFVKLDATDGKEIWKTKLPGQAREVNEKKFDGGFYSSAILGINDCQNLVYANVVENLKGSNGALVAFDRSTGNIAFKTPLKYYSWSSPVRFIDKNGKMYIVTGDGLGYIYIVDGHSGSIIISKQIGANFESSPVVVNNTIVIGSRGNSIFKISLK